MSDCPHVFFVGNQPRFDTLLLRHQSLYHHHRHPSSSSSSSSRHEVEDQVGDGDGDAGEGSEKEKEKKMIRLITIPSFKETGQVVLLDLDDLGVQVLAFDIFQ